jgi:hypothetical protein
LFLAMRRHELLTIILNGWANLLATVDGPARKSPNAGAELIWI